MQVKNTSWHFKLATEYGGLTHFYGYKNPSFCVYLWSVLWGAFMFLLTEIIFSWIVPIGVDILFFSILFAIIFGFFNISVAIMFIIALFFYIGLVVAYYKDYESYIGPLCILQRFTKFELFKNIIEKICQPVKIVYVKEEN